jgi:hypothetical protein
VDDIAKVVTDYSGTQGFDLVLDKSASATTSVPTVLFNSGKLTDITPDIINKLNATAPPTSLTVPASPAQGLGTPAVQ